jgi:hypothetical protein
MIPIPAADMAVATAAIVSFPDLSTYAFFSDSVLMTAAVSSFLN